MKSTHTFSLNLLLMSRHRIWRATVKKPVLVKATTLMLVTGMMLMVVVLPMVPNTEAAGRAAASVSVQPNQDAKELANLLNADGTVNLSAGITGSFDASGYRLELGANQEPRFVPRSVQTGCMDNWDDRFATPGTDNIVWALVVDSNNNLYIGGDFNRIFNVTASRVAKWDGNTWSPLGSPAQNGVNGSVFALTVMGTDLFVGGNFTAASDSTQLNISVNRVARWSTTSNNWSPLGSAAQNGVNGSVFALTAIDTDLFVGGPFTTASASTQLNLSTQNIARWSTTSNNWSPLGSLTQNGVNSAAWALTVMGTDLYVGGNFNTANDSTQSNISVNHIARWSTNTNTWSPLGSGLLNGVSDLVTSLATIGTDLYVGGAFFTASDNTQLNISVNHIARWNTTTSSWSPLGSPTQNGMNLGGQVNALAVMGTDLFVSGNFTAANSSTQLNISVNRVARWNSISGTWSPLGIPAQNGMNNQVNALAVLGTDLYVGGEFTTASDSTQLNISVNRFARWNTTTSSWLPQVTLTQNGVEGISVNALVVIGTDLYVGGFFSFVGNAAANNIAKWDGVSWSPLGNAIQNGLSGGQVRAFTVIGSDLYVGGSFTTASDSTQVISANRVARWNTTTSSWSLLGSPTQNGVNSAVWALTVTGSDLYIGGSFTTASDSTQLNISVNRIARWSTTTSSWSPLGSPTQNGMNLGGQVNALAVMGTDLYIGGSFPAASDSTQLNLSVNRIARWSTTTSSWSPLGSGLRNGVNNTVNALVIFGSDLYVGGNFITASDSTQLNISVNHIARWSTTTSSWSPLGSPTQNGMNLGGQVNALAVINADLYVGGEFITASSSTQLNISVNRVARWSTTFSNWQSLDGGMNGGVFALAPIDNNLYVGGNFGTAGCRVSSLLARYSILLPEIDLKGNSISITDGDTTPSPTDYTDFGSASVNGEIITRIFTIENMGPGALILGGNPAVTISGMHAADFTVTAQPAPVINSGNSTTFTVQFDPSAVGLRTATVTIGNSDTDENPYDFSIQGSGFAIAIWTGASSSDWHTASNWTGNTVPAYGSNILLPATGVINEAIISTADVTVGNLTLATPRTLTISNNRTLNLNSSAAVTINSGAAMIINSGCTIICSSGVNLVNEGTLTINQGGTINNGFAATLTNNNTFNNNFGAAVNNNFGATLTNNNGATFNNTGTLNNNFGGTVNNFGLLADLGTFSNSGTLALQNGNLTVNSSALLIIRASGTVTRTSGYVLGKMTKTFAAASSFTFDVGTANGYSPVQVTTTAGSGDLTIGATQTFQPALSSASNKVLQRYWTLTATGNLTTNLVFNYLQADVMGNESIYQIIRVAGSTPTPIPNACPSPCINPANNTATINGVTNFSDWTLGEPSASTAIELVSFNAKGYDGGNFIEWETGFEAGNLGFNLYRDEGGKRVQVNPQLLAGSALLAGADTVLRAGRTYSWWDKTELNKLGASTSYWLEEVDLSGISTMHGPFLAQPQGGAPPARSEAESLSRIGQSQSSSNITLPLERAASLLRVTSAKSGLQTSLASQAAVKICINREGWYRISAAELFAAGLDAKADPQRLQLYVEGQQIPINLMTDAQGKLAVLDFYGRGLDAAYTDTRVYWLTVGAQAGLRIPQVKASGLATAARSFFTTVERRDRSVYVSALRNDEKENFFGAVITSSPIEQTLTLRNVEQTASGHAELEVALQGLTTQPHRVRAYINGMLAGELQFSNQSANAAKFAVAHALLKEGDNQIQLVAQNGSGDVSLVDSLRLSYWHRFTADANALRLNVNGRQAVTINGFTSSAIRVFDATNPEVISELAGKIETQPSGYAVTVTAPETGVRQLLAIADERAARPVKLLANQPSSLRTTARAAELIILTTREMMPAFETLAQWRIKQGIKAEVIDLEDVYDEFSYGSKSPQAVKDFLNYVANNWQTKPRFVLLGGDASFDPKNYLGFGNLDVMPTKFIDTQLMEAASDDWFADFNDDGLADLVVGRLPARTIEAAKSMVEKLVGYDQSAPIESVLLVADRKEGYDFEEASQQLKNLIPATVRVDQLNRGQMDDATAKGELLAAIERGERLINYTGHGTVNGWHGSLLTNDEVSRLTNKEHLPVFVMMTCLNGYFADPGSTSLAESLVSAEDGGAVAVWASSGMTPPEEQAVMNQQLYRLIFAGNGNGLFGEMTRQAKQLVTNSDIRRTWILFGDPSMRLK